MTRELLDAHSGYLPKEFEGKTQRNVNHLEIEQKLKDEVDACRLELERQASRFKAERSEITLKFERQIQDAQMQMCDG